MPHQSDEESSLNLLMSDVKKSQESERARLTDELIKSNDRYKLVIAGAGTGKSFTFKALLKEKEGRSLAVTFINNLASELKSDLDGLAEAYTFHKFCKKLLHSMGIDGLTSRFHYFPKLHIIIESDSKHLAGGKYKNFRKAFQNLKEEEDMGFFLSRASYYDAVSHDDSVYRVLKSFQADSSAIPVFGQVVVDEYQDFNLLEVSFIDELAKLSPTLIVGDDDQAVYEDLKDASARFIREKALDKSFKRFSLPFCSRCTEVIIGAVHDIIDRAKQVGRLVGRIDKEYVCYLPDKEVDSIQYPKIIHAACSTQRKADNTNYIARYIESEINKITQEEWEIAKEKGYPCVLIVGQSQYTKQVYDYLAKKFEGIDFKEATNEKLDLLDGYAVLLKDSQSNLGWRVILEMAEKDKRVKTILMEAEMKGLSIVDVLDNDFRNEHLATLEILKKIKKEEVLSTIEEQALKDKFEETPEELKGLLSSDSDSHSREEKGYDSIKITSFNGCKGLSASFVFLIGLNEGEFPKAKPTDKEICQFIVGLTRTRKQCYLISNKSFGLKLGMNPSVFVARIDQSRIFSVVVNADFFKKLP